MISREPGASRQMAWQLLRSGTSVGANAEEAKAAPSALPPLLAEANELVSIYTAAVRKAKAPIGGSSNLE